VICFGTQTPKNTASRFLIAPRFIVNLGIPELYTACNIFLEKNNTVFNTYLQMPNKRDPNQKLLGIWMDKELMDLVDTGRRRIGQQRSQFVRESIIEKLRHLGYEVGYELALPPDRTKSTHSQHASPEEKNAVETDSPSSESENPKDRERVNEALKEAAERLAAHVREKDSKGKKARKKQATT